MSVIKTDDEGLSEALMPGNIINMEIGPHPRGDRHILRDYTTVVNICRIIGGSFRESEHVACVIYTIRINSGKVSEISYV